MMKKFDDTEPAKSLVKYASKLKPSKAIDIGCGKGKNAIWLAQNGWQVEAIEPHSQWLEISKLKAQDKCLSAIKFVETNIEKYSTQSQFDLVVCAMVLHFLSRNEISQATEKIKALTKSNGSIFISVMSDQNPIGARPTLFEPGQLEGYFIDWKVVRAFQIETEPLLMPGKSQAKIFYFDYLIAKKY